MLFCLFGLFGKNSLLIWTTLPYDSKYTIQWGFQFLLKLSINDLYAHCIYFEYLRYKVLIYFLCGLFGINSLLIWTNFPYKSISSIQWGCQLLLKIAITDLYAYYIFVEYLRYRVLKFCFWGSFGGNSLLILSSLSYNIYSSIQWGCQLLLKLYITDLYAYYIFV